MHLHLPHDGPRTAWPRALSRRGFFGSLAALASAAVLPTLVGCAPSASLPQPGMAFLAQGDAALFRALIPAIASELTELGAGEREQRLQQAIRNIDGTCAALSPRNAAQLRQLLDLLASTPLRWALTGVRGPWEQASPQQMQAFLERWRASGIATLNAGGMVLIKLSSAGYYVLPSTWAGSGYPGPTPALYRALHA